MCDDVGKSRKGACDQRFNHRPGETAQAAAQGGDGDRPDLERPNDAHQIAGRAVQIDGTIVVAAAAYDVEDGSAVPDSAYVWSTRAGRARRRPTRSRRPDAAPDR